MSTNRAAHRARPAGVPRQRVRGPLARPRPPARGGRRTAVDRRRWPLPACCCVGAGAWAALVVLRDRAPSPPRRCRTRRSATSASTSTPAGGRRSRRSGRCRSSRRSRTRSTSAPTTTSASGSSRRSRSRRTLRRASTTTTTSSPGSATGRGRRRRHRRRRSRPPVVVLQVTDDGRGRGRPGQAQRRAAAAHRRRRRLGDRGRLGGASARPRTSSTRSPTTPDAGTLADDDDFQHWTDEAGDAGIVTMYAAPGAGDFLADNLDELSEGFGDLGGLAGSRRRASATPAARRPARAQPTTVPMPLQDFEGAAATIRFDDGASSSRSPRRRRRPSKSRRRRRPGRRRRRDPARRHRGRDRARLRRRLAHRPRRPARRHRAGAPPTTCWPSSRTQTGLDLPEDAETLVGESAALAVGPTSTPTRSSADDPSERSRWG